MTTAETAIVGAEGEYVRAKTSVLWDIENCEVPRGWDANMIAKNVSSALLKMNYCGPVSITAYGDTNLIPRHVQQALSSTGVALHHVPAGVKDASDKKILVDMLLWAVDNPAPANYMLISGDRDFSNALHQLSMRRYTILLAQPPRASAPLVSAAKFVWLWTSLASGGPPLTSVESSGLLNNGRCQVSNNEVSKNLVSEQAQSSKSSDTSSDGGDIKDSKANAPRGSPQGTRRNLVQNGRGGTNEYATTCRICNVVCDSFDKLMAHTSEPRHIAQVALLNSRKAKAIVSTKPIHEAGEPMEPVWCETCGISCISKEAYKGHTYGKRHRSNVELQSGKSNNMSAGLVEPPKEVLEKQKNRKASDGRARANANYICRLCNVRSHCQISFECHLRGQRHATMLSQSETLNDSKKLQWKSVGEKDQPSDTIAVPQLQSQDAKENAFEKHVANLSQSEVLNDPKKLQEIEKKDQPSETFAVPQLQSQEAQENTIEKHAANVSQSEVLIGSKKLQETGVKEEDQPSEAIAAPKPKADYVCRLCNVTCQHQSVFDSHLKGKKHAANVSQPEALKFQENGVREKDQPKETVAEPKLKSLNAQKNTKCLEKHVNLVNQSEALNDSKKIQEKGAGETLAEAQSQNVLETSKSFGKQVDTALVNSRMLEENGVKKKVQSISTIVEPQWLSQNTQKNTKFFENQNKDWAPQYSFSTKPINPVVPVWCLVCHIICDSQIAYENHTYGKGHRQKLELQSAKNEKKSKGPDKLSKESAEKWSMKKVACQNQIVFDSHQKEHAEGIVDSGKTPEESDNGKEKTKEQAVEKIGNLAFTELKREPLIQKKSRDPLGVDSEGVKLPPEWIWAKNIQKQTVSNSHLQSQNDVATVKELTENEPADLRRVPQETTVEQTLDLGLQGAHEDGEEVKEINDISKNLDHFFMGSKLPYQESRIPKEPRVCSDVVPEGVKLPPNVNVTEKLDVKSKQLLEPKSCGPVNQSAGSKEHPGELPKKEEIKSPADNFWNRFWGKK